MTFQTLVRRILVALTTIAIVAGVAVVISNAPEAFRP